MSFLCLLFQIVSLFCSITQINGEHVVKILETYLMTTSLASHKVSFIVLRKRSTWFGLFTISFHLSFPAFEILGNPSRRHAYDSVDPFLSNHEPSVEEIKKDFFGVLNKFFLEKARWSKRQPTPFLGHRQSPLEHVHRFYDFWLVRFSDNLLLDATILIIIFASRMEYETTKDFSFLDEEDKEKGEE